MVILILDKGIPNDEENGTKLPNFIKYPQP